MKTMTTTETMTTKKTNHHSFYFKVMVVLVGQVLAAVVVLAAVGLDPAEAAFPGANGKIVFQSSRVVRNEIFMMKSDGSNETPITHQPLTNAKLDLDPDWGMATQ